MNGRLSPTATAYSTIGHLQSPVPLEWGRRSTSGRNDDVLLAAGDRDAPLIVNRGKISGA